jgi:hypothetical protein
MEASATPPFTARAKRFLLDSGAARSMSTPPFTVTPRARTARRFLDPAVHRLGMHFPSSPVKATRP